MLRNFDMYNMILMIPAILIGFTFHEYAHAKVADTLGDKTPRFQGRLSLNPLVHVDIFGFLMILLAGFGWAKPVQTNPSAYKNYYKDDLKVSIAGPLANLSIAVLTAILLGIFLRVINYMPANKLNHIIFGILNNILYINVMLFLFNLIPIPGLDGFHVLMDLFPGKMFKFADTIYRYQTVIIILFIITPISTYLIGVPSNFIANRLLDLSIKLAGF